MKATGSLILNEICGIETKTYLELGIGNNKNFNQIRALMKTSVDINGRAIFTGTTHEFFQACRAETSWDLVFIDADHDHEQVVEDFNSAILHCNEWILIHDMIPPTARHTAHNLCSDSYRLLYYLLTARADLQIFPMAENYGLTFIRMPARHVTLPLELRYLTFDAFQALINRTRLYNHDEMIRILNP
jgi:hypothetical protein